MTFNSKHGHDTRLGAPPILEFYADNLGSQGSYTGLDLFVAFDHQSLAVQVVGPDDLPDPLAYYDSLPFPWGHKYGPDLQGTFQFIIQTRCLT